MLLQFQDDSYCCFRFPFFRHENSTSKSKENTEPTSDKKILMTHFEPEFYRRDLNLNTVFGLINRVVFSIFR